MKCGSHTTPGGEKGAIGEYGEKQETRTLIQNIDTVSILFIPH
jgi:hypothetical protein